MYKQNNSAPVKWEAFKRSLNWIKRKTILILVAFMIGFSNGMTGKQDTVDDNQNYIEQKDKKH